MIGGHDGQTELGFLMQTRIGFRPRPAKWDARFRQPKRLHDGQCVQCWMRPCTCQPGCWECDLIAGEIGPQCEYCFLGASNEKR